MKPAAGGRSGEAFASACGEQFRTTNRGEPKPTLPSVIPPVLTTEQLAALLKCSPTQVRRMDLPAIEVGRGRWRYITSQVLEELAERAKRGGLTLHKRAS